MKKLAKKNKNKGALRSQRLLTEAFFEILSEKPVKRIKVTALCDRAGVSTPTFYAHYNVIEDIPYQYYLDQWLAELSVQIDTFTKEFDDVFEIILRFTEWVFNYWAQEIDVFRSLKAQEMESIVLQLFSDGTNLAWEKLWGDEMSKINPITQELLTLDSVNRMFMVFNLWVKTEMKNSARDMAEIILFLSPKEPIEKLSAYFD